MAGRATGERIEPRRTARVIAGVANGMSVNKVSKFANVDRATATAIVERNAATIQQRKERLTDIYAEIAQRGAERLLDGIETAPYGSLIPITGMSTDKLIALTQDPQSQLNQHLHLHLDSSNHIEQWNEMCKRLPVVESNLRKSASVDDNVVSVASTEANTIEVKAEQIQIDSESPT
jgi:hypothetical protein